mgnify:CR=1 FL=1
MELVATAKGNEMKLKRKDVDREESQDLSQLISNLSYENSELIMIVSVSICVLSIGKLLMPTYMYLLLLVSSLSVNEMLRLFQSLWLSSQ